MKCKECGVDSKILWRENYGEISMCEKCYFNYRFNVNGNKKVIIVEDEK